MNPKKHKPEVLNFTTKAIAHFKHKLSAQGKENKIRLGVKSQVVTVFHTILNL